MSFNLEFEFNSKEAKQWSKLGPRAMYGQFMLKMAEECESLMVLSADLGRSSGLDRFKAKYPDKYLSVGISEQNLIGIASGLAREGHKVFISSFAPFLSMRSSEQIRMNLGYMELPVNIVALGSGVSMAFLGNSHFGLEDLAVMRAIPNINISSPADCGELGKVLNDYCYNSRGPSYIRLTGVPGSPIVYENDYNYKFGIPYEINKGKNILILATGSIVGQTKIALEKLQEFGVNPSLYNIHTLRNKCEYILNLIKKYKIIITVEEHSIIGGLASIVSEVIAQNNFRGKLFPIALPNSFGPTGEYRYLLDHHGLTGDKIFTAIKEIL